MGASAAAARAGSTLSSTTCELTLTYGTRASKKKLPKSTSVAALKLLISRLFKVAPDRQRLLLHGGPEGRAPEELSGDDTRTLGYYDAVVSSHPPHIHLSRFMVCLLWCVLWLLQGVWCGCCSGSHFAHTAVCNAQQEGKRHSLLDA
jgi:hypothetical protein